MDDQAAKVQVSRRDLLKGGAAVGVGVVALGGLWRPARAQTKRVVKLSFIGPLTGGTASNGLGGRNSFLLAVAERNADPKSKYRYETIVLDDECKPTVGVQAALKAGSDPEVIASVSHYCSVVAIATVDTFNKLGLPSMVWGAVLPDITYGHTHVEVSRVNGTMINQNH
ncbi:MAG: ABC transporter substrate-binding protein, partial [Candidatus Rokubacteria bacterium]|nr:ABC transporter substrate-binding protein [Candidatus Rokubacteria bacterium]